MEKLDETKPSHTLVAHLGKDTYSHIHPIEPRGITVREAARLQSFPDDFSLIVLWAMHLSKLEMLCLHCWHMELQNSVEYF